MDLAPLAALILNRPHGLIALATTAGDDVRHALWRALAQCESLYWVGPLAEKPVVEGPARCWLLECTLEERSAGLREVMRLDPHAIHAVGLADAAVWPQLVQAALVGCVVVAEVDARSATDAIASVRATDVDAFAVTTALMAGVGVDGELLLTAPTPP